MTLDQVATKLLEALQPLTADGPIVITRVDFRSKAAPFSLTPRGTDTKAAAAGKLLQVIGSATNTGGGFYITVDHRAVPRPPAFVPAKFVPPKYHPPGERRYWERASIERP